MPPAVARNAWPPSDVPPWKVNVNVICQPEQSACPSGVCCGHGQSGAPDGTSLGFSLLARNGPSGKVLMDASQFEMFWGKIGGMHRGSGLKTAVLPWVQLP